LGLHFENGFVDEDVGTCMQKVLFQSPLEIAKLKDLKKSTNQKHNQSKNCASKK
jgi:hypothetical protein